jgi:uncharacterized protein (TIGR02687 family)
MDIGANGISTRLSTALSKGHRTVFWEDPSGTYRSVLAEISIPGARVLDATGSELACKREILRGDSESRFVVYRSGEVPTPTEDLLYDTKLASMPFTCSMEGLWAEECGIRADLAPVLAEHAAFFNSSERRAGLARTELPKDDHASLELAMAAAVLLVREGVGRDVARAMAERAIVEWARGSETSMSMLRDSGLIDVFWHEMATKLGYRWPAGGTPSVEDLAYRVLEGTFGGLVDDEMAMPQSECARIVSGLASRRTIGDLRTVTDRLGGEALGAVPAGLRTPRVLADVDSVPQVDEVILSAFTNQASGSGVDPSELGEVIARRRHSIWSGSFENHYGTLAALSDLLAGIGAYRAGSPSANSLEQLLDNYASSWWRIDASYRRLSRCWRATPSSGRFHARMGGAVSSAYARYDEYVADVTERWQARLMERGSWPPEGLPAQSSFFHDHVEAELPEARDGKRVGVIVSDALRYEAGQEAAERLTASAMGRGGALAVSCDAAVGMLPSYTQLGMAALLPSGGLRIDPSTQAVTKAGSPTQGTAARGSLLAGRYPGAIAIRAADVLEAGEVPDIAAAPVVFVYHNDIDATGDHRSTEGEVFEAVDSAVRDIGALASILLNAGCGVVLVTSDHGFLYQDHDVDDSQLADVPGLTRMRGADGVEESQTRRFVVGDTLPKSDYLLEWAASKLSLVGSYEVGLARGTMRLRLCGSGARYVHGGASPQEDVIPVVTVRRARAKANGVAHQTSVDAYPVGRTAITGSVVMLDVYQCEPVGGSVAPVTAKVGVYSEDGALVSSQEQTLELASQSPNVEDRKIRITLRLTDDVDGLPAAIVRVSTKVGETNRFKVAWERPYSVNRAFGSDF